MSSLGDRGHLEKLVDRETGVALVKFLSLRHLRAYLRVYTRLHCPLRPGMRSSASTAHISSPTSTISGKSPIPACKRSFTFPVSPPSRYFSSYLIIPLSMSLLLKIHLYGLWQLPCWPWLSHWV
ncbi:hypothetical protein LB505_013567 [Fusarium chuoi]|nr:hypothetical protein LB505_013567 [Fusarium chuoi]